MCESTKKVSNNIENSTGSCMPTLFNLTGFNHKKVEVLFNAEQVSNDGGLLLLKEVENQIGIINSLASCVKDTRHQSYVKHGIGQMLRQRIMQIAAGYEDANDCNVLRNDGILKVCTGQEQSMATQPTMSRFENQVGNRELYNMGKVFVDGFISSYPSQPDVISTGLRRYSRITLRATGTGAFQHVLRRHLLHAVAHIRRVFGKIDNNHPQTGTKEQKHKCICPAPKAHCILAGALAKYNDYPQGRQPFLLRAVYGLGRGAKKC